jgi:hypothetical protein
MENKTMRFVKTVTVCFGEEGCWEFPSPWPFGSHDLALDVPDIKEENTAHYKKLFSDASIVQGIHQATRHISDSGTRAALESGIASAVKAMEKRGAAKKVKITLSD